MATITEWEFTADIASQITRFCATDSNCLLLPIPETAREFHDEALPQEEALSRRISVR